MATPPMIEGSTYLNALLTGFVEQMNALHDLKDDAAYREQSALLAAKMHIELHQLGFCKECTHV
jgi:hypothetical protein